MTFPRAEFSTYTESRSGLNSDWLFGSNWAVGRWAIFRNNISSYYISRCLGILWIIFHNLYFKFVISDTEFYHHLVDLFPSHSAGSIAWHLKLSKKVSILHFKIPSIERVHDPGRGGVLTHFGSMVDLARMLVDGVKVVEVEDRRMGRMLVEGV